MDPENARVVAHLSDQCRQMAMLNTTQTDKQGTEHE